jgi:hypothetical protein
MLEFQKQVFRKAGELRHRCLKIKRLRAPFQDGFWKSAGSMRSLPFFATVITSGLQAIHQRGMVHFASIDDCAFALCR